MQRIRGILVLALALLVLACAGADCSFDADCEVFCF